MKIVCKHSIKNTKFNLVFYTKISVFWADIIWSKMIISKQYDFDTDCLLNTNSESWYMVLIN